MAWVAALAGCGGGTTPTSDSGFDAAFDAATDASVDDSSTDAETDSGFDAGFDSGTDAATDPDAATDAATDPDAATDAATDAAAGPFCGDGVVNGTELCDLDCPTSCDDSNLCTTDVLVGSAATCSAECTFAAIRACTDADGCCAPGCNFTNDDDCPAPPAVLLIHEVLYDGVGADAAEAFIELYGPPGTSLDGYDVDGDCSAATFAGEGSPVARGVAGASTSRDDAHSDTDDNVVDFSVGVPSPGADGPYAMATTPRLIDPLAAARVTSGDVPFRWELPAGDTGAQLELCDDAARASVITTIDATGCTWAARVASRRAWR